MTRKRVLSGMRPTGRLHMGHLFGALDNWRTLQETYECFFFVADWHALTTEYAEPSKIREFTTEVVLDWLAAGLDPQKATFFVQSRLPEHAEIEKIHADFADGILEITVPNAAPQESRTHKIAVEAHTDTKKLTSHH